MTLLSILDTGRIAGKKGMTLLEVLVVIAIIAVLLGILIPAVGYVRAQSDLVGCKANLKQVGMALHGYHDVNGSFPPGCSFLKGKSLFPHMGWEARILPYIEQMDLWKESETAYRQKSFFLENPPHTALSKVVRIYVCPADGRCLVSRSPLPAFTSYLGVEGTNQFAPDGVLFLDSKIGFRDVRDGASATIMVGERPPRLDGSFGWWYAGWGQDKDGSADMLLGARETNTMSPWGAGCPEGPYEFSAGRLENQCDVFHFWSIHSGGSNFLFVDGSARFAGYSFNIVLPAAATRQGGESGIQTGLVD